MSHWADRKRRKIIFILLGIFFLLITLSFLQYKRSQKPTCFDGVKNGTETGIDCGGSCARLCEEEARNLIVWWERPFKVTDGVYNLLAYVENQNVDAGLEKIDYEFRVYDKDNVLVAEPRRGTTFVEANKRFAIFEPSVTTGGKEAFTVFFKILSKSQWKKVNPDFRYNLFQVINPMITRLATNPHLHVKLKNKSLYDFVDIPVVAIIYNHRGNAIAVSQTYLDKIEHNAVKDIYFSWPEPFGKDIARIEIIPRINPFLDIEKAPQSSL